MPTLIAAGHRPGPRSGYLGSGNRTARGGD